jgi:hypothetical protein
MRLEIDTKFKTIKVLEYQVSLKELIQELAILFPEEAFMEYTLHTEYVPPFNNGGQGFPNHLLNPPWGSAYGSPIITSPTIVNPTF